MTNIIDIKSAALEFMLDNNLVTKQSSSLDKMMRYMDEKHIILYTSISEREVETPTL